MATVIFEFCVLSAHCCLQFLEMHSSFSLSTCASFWEQVLQNEPQIIGPFFCCTHNICLNTLTRSNQEAHFAALFLIHLCNYCFWAPKTGHVRCFSRFEMLTQRESAVKGQRRPDNHRHLALVMCLRRHRRLAKMAETFCFASKMGMGSLPWWCMLIVQTIVHATQENVLDLAVFGVSWDASFSWWACTVYRLYIQSRVQFQCFIQIL